MFKKINIKNIGPHEDLELNLHPGINGIIGLSQSGKTEILRALYLLAFNRPINFYRNHHSKFAREDNSIVSVITDEDIRIKLKKTSKQSNYFLAYPDGRKGGESTLRFGKLKGIIPDEIKNALNISEINIQRQRDSAFMVDSTPGDIAKTINKITNIDKIDNWIKKISEKINFLKTQKIVIEEDLNEINSKLRKLKYLKDLGPKIDKLKIIEKRKFNLQREIDILDDNIRTIKETKIKIKRFERHLPILESFYKRLKQIEKEKIELQNQRVEIDKLFMADASIRELQKEQKRDSNLYIIELRKQSKCPTCLKPITLKDIRKIIYEIRSTQ